MSRRPSGATWGIWSRCGRRGRSPAWGRRGDITGQDSEMDHTEDSFEAAVTSVMACEGGFMVTAVGPGGESVTWSTPDQYHEVGQLVGCTVTPIA